MAENEPKTVIPHRYERKNMILKTKQNQTIKVKTNTTAEKDPHQHASLANDILKSKRTNAAFQCGITD